MPSPGSPKRDFLMRHREGLLLVVLVIVSLLIISKQVRDPAGMTYFKKFVISVMAPFQSGSSTVVGGVSGLWNDYVYLFGIRKENRLLRSEVNELRTEVQLLREELYRAGQLEEFTAYQTEAGFVGMAARVIGESPDPWVRTLTISRGLSDGLQRNMPVVTPDGLAGSIVEVAEHSAVVRLIIDRSLRVPVLVVRTRARAILEGENYGTCQLKYLDRTEDVQVGDVVITSGLAGTYPRGIEVGTVTQIVKKKHGLYQYAKILPKAPLNRLEDVLVVLAGQGRDQE